ncbi:MAG: hypothetical protein SFU25_04135 [Candidatus Caenarcaniphilales bacterium]|nr:hypothetical protein [Candidatus Caenarcaniphilales bacterium]
MKVGFHSSVLNSSRLPSSSVLHKPRKSQRLVLNVSKQHVNAQQTINEADPKKYLEIHEEIIKGLIKIRCLKEGAAKAEDKLHGQIFDVLAEYILEHFPGEFEKGRGSPLSTNINDIRQSTKMKDWIDSLKQAHEKQQKNDELQEFFNLLKPFKDKATSMPDQFIERWNEIATILGENDFIISKQISDSTHPTSGSSRRENQNSPEKTGKYSTGVIAGIGLTVLTVAYLIYSYLSKLLSNQVQQASLTGGDGAAVLALTENSPKTTNGFMPAEVPTKVS